MALSILLATVAFFSSTSSSAFDPAQDRGPRLPALDAEIQAGIQRVVHGPADVTIEERHADLDRLQRLGGTDYERLVPQLFLYSRRATTTREAMAFGVIVAALRVPDGSIVRSLVPFLELEDARVFSDVAGYLSEFEGRSADRRPSFEHYRGFLSEPAARGEALPEGLLRYLFDGDPGVAVLLLMRVQRAPAEEQRAILWAEHVIAGILWQEEQGLREPGAAAPGARAELLRMVRHSAWYARLFAVRILVRAPHLGERAWLEDLTLDPDPRVRRAALQGLARDAR